MPTTDRPRQRSRVVAYSLDDELVLYDEVATEVHVLNPTAAFIWTQCNGGRSIDAIAEAVAARFGIPLAHALADVWESVEGLEQAGLIAQGLGPESRVPTSTAMPPGPAVESGPERAEIDILGFRAEVTGPGALVADLGSLFPRAPDWARAGDDRPVARFVVEPHPSGPGSHQIFRDGALTETVESPDDLLAMLEWVLSSAAVQHLQSQYLIFHSGCVAYAGRGVVLPGPPGSGKTTLVAGLVASGFRYLSDEIAVLQPATMELLPFARAMGVKEGAREALATLYPQLAAAAPRRRFGDERVWYLCPPEDAWPERPVPLRYVVLPRFEPGRSPTLTPIPRPQALRPMLDQSFNLRAHGAHGVAGLVDALKGARCYALSFGDVGAATALLRQMANT